MDIYQCPVCELRFRLGNELLQHVSLDHPDFSVKSKSEEDALLAAAHRHRHARRYQAGTDQNSP